MAAGDSQSSLRVPRRGERTRVSSAALIDTWTSHAWDDGIRVDRLQPLDRLAVRTAHSLYEIVVVAPATGEIQVRGGAFFPAWTPARLAGSSLGGSFLKLHAIYVGFRMEMINGRRSIVTSTVRALSIARAGADDTHPKAIH
jgi:hypothetical protein